MGVTLPSSLRDFSALLAQADASHIGRLMDNIIAGVSTLSQELGKPCPDVKISGDMNRLYLSDEHSVRLESVMTHIIRNCLDHGIESAQERTRAGKPEKGAIAVDLATTSTGAILTIADNGRGLALTRLRNKAESLSLLTPEDLASDEHVAELIFHSGLSTTEKVSMISGRGVGMDAVRSALAEVGATIKVQWLDTSLANPDYPGAQLVISASKKASDNARYATSYSRQPSKATPEQQPCRHHRPPQAPYQSPNPPPQ